MTERRPSILPDAFRGVGFITGYRGIGKSFLMAQADFAQNIAFLNCDGDKGESIREMNDFGFFKSMTKDTRVLEGGGLALWDVLMDTIQGLEKDRYTVLVIDNIAPIQLAMDAEAVRNAGKYAREYGLDQSKIRRNAWGHQGAVSNELVKKVCDMIHDRGVRFILVSTHIKPAWAGGQQVPNKYRIKGKDRWQELSIMTLILIPGDNPPVPAALVQKEQLGIIRSLDPSKMTPTEIESIRRGESPGHEVSRRLPRRIPDCTFQKIRGYLENPTRIDEPEEGEVPTYEESDPFDSRLSREQFEFVRMAQRSREIEEETERSERSTSRGSVLIQTPEDEKVNGQVQEVRDKIKELTSTSPTLSLEDIRSELLKEYPLPLVLLATG